MKVGLGEEKREFGEKVMVNVSICGVDNPLWGWKRMSLGDGRDFDAWDFSVFPVTSYWSPSFSLSISNPAGEITAATYPNINRGYTGYLPTGRSVIINDVTLGMREKRVEVRVGTMSGDVRIETEGEMKPCQAKKLVLSPQTSPLTPDNGNLRYTSLPSNFTLSQSFHSTSFRIGASISTPPGEYILTWTLQETLQTGVETRQYEQPLSTLVYVTQGDPIPVSISGIPDIWVGGRMPPVRVSLPFSPHTHLSIYFYVSGAPIGIHIQPSVVHFYEYDTERYFTINVTNRYNLTSERKTETVVVSVSGEDAEAYRCGKEVNFSVIERQEDLEEREFSGEVGEVKRTMAGVRMDVNVPGTIYWWLGVTSTPIPSFFDLLSSIPPLTTSPSKSPADFHSLSLETQETDPKYREYWTDFQKRLYRSHLSSTWTDSISTSSPSLSLNFTWLWADTQYTFQAYFLTISEEILELTLNFTTLPCPFPQPIHILFSGTVSSVFSTKISYILAKYMGVHPYRLFNASCVVMGEGSERRLEESEGQRTRFEYTLLPDRFVESLTPEVQSRLIGIDYISFQNDLQTQLGISNPLLSVTNQPFPRRSPVGWTYYPRFLSATNNSVTLKLRADAPGSACCLALNKTYSSPSPMQIFLGVNPDNLESPQKCIPTNTTSATNEAKIQGLESDSSYFVYCVVTDDYPLWSTVGREVMKVDVRTLVYNNTQTQELNAGWVMRVTVVLGVVVGLG